MPSNCWVVLYFSNLPSFATGSVLARKLGDSTRFFETRKLLMQAYLLLNDITKANKIAESDGVLYYFYVPMCFKAGLPARFLKQIEDEELKGAEANLVNLHHAGTSFGKVAGWYAEAGLIEQYVSVLKRAMALIPKAMKAWCRPWQLASFFCELAPAAKVANDAKGLQHLVSQAEKWAEEQSNSKNSRDDISMVWVGMSDMYAKIGFYEKAIAAAKRIPKKERSRQKLSHYYAQLNRDKEIDAELRKCKTIHGKVEFLESIARGMIP